MSDAPAPTERSLVWYAAYGSNLDADRFRCYLLGGRPAGATRTYPGARESREPLDVRPFAMSGRLCFAWESPTWGGGIAFHEPATPAEGAGRVLARAYLLTTRQLADVVEQEMWRAPGADHDLGEVLRNRRHTFGPGRYETLHLVGELDGRPVLTFSADDVTGLGVRAPSAAYLRTMARGLRQAHGLADDALVDYLMACRGTDLDWDRPRLAALLGGGAAQ